MAEKKRSIAPEAGLRQMAVRGRCDAHADAPFVHRLQGLDDRGFDLDLFEIAGLDKFVDLVDDPLLALRDAELVLHVERHGLEEHGRHDLVLLGSDRVAEASEVAPADLDPQVHGLGQGAVHVENGAFDGHLLTFVSNAFLISIKS